MKKIIEFNLKEFINNEMGFEERRRMINFFPKSLQEEFTDWLKGKA